jgi:hypothetical protein
MVARMEGKGSEQIVVPSRLDGLDRALSRNSVKWRNQTYLFGFLVNTSVVDRSIVYSATNQSNISGHGFSQLQYKLALQRQTNRDFCSRKRLERKRTMTYTANSPRNFQCLMNIEGMNNVGAYCSSKKRKEPSGRGF